MPPLDPPLPRSPSKDPDIFQYLSWMSFIDHYLSAVVARNQKRLARSTGCSQAQMSNIRTRSEPGDDSAPVTRYVPDIAAAMSLDPRETRFFHALVQYRQSKKDSPEHRAAAQVIRSEHRFQNALRLHPDELDYLRHPFAVTIREMARSPAFRDDAAWIRDRLLPRPTLAAVREALALLTRLGLLRREASGDVSPSQVGIVVDDFDGELERERRAESDALLKRRHAEHISLALKALEGLAGDERYVSGNTALVPVEAFADLTLRLREWQMQWATYAEEMDVVALRRARVYRLNLQFFPLSKLVEDEEDEDE